MIEQLDREIAELEARLAGLRLRKLEALQAQVAALQATIGGSAPAAAAAPAPVRRGGRPRKDGSPAGSPRIPAAAAPAAAAAPEQKRRGGRPRKDGSPAGSPRVVSAAPAAAPEQKRRGGRPRKDGSPAGSPRIPAAAAAPAKERKGKRGRKPGKRVPDDVILGQLTDLVTAAGETGVSAREVAQRTGHFYPKVIKLMKKHFKSRGKGKFNRYFAK